MKRNKGFTLIELLVVIAIIGILSAIVLASLNQARSKAQDSKIQSQLAGMRAAAEIYYTGNANSYSPAINKSNTLDCSQSVSLFGDLESGMQKIASSTPGLICYATESQWAATAPLVSNSTLYWCVDSTGVSHQVTPDPLGTPPVISLTEPSCPAS